MENNIQNIVRGICVKDGALLLAYHKKDNYYFLPGGHVEFGEALNAALEREFMEELNSPIKCHGLITVFEHSWDNKGKLQHEINYYFAVELSNPNDALQSQVEYLSFEWISIDKLSEINFLPSAILSTIIDNLAGKPTMPLISTLNK